MTIESLGIIKTQLDSIGINYEFGEWSKNPVYPYFVGNYSESESINEDGMQESTFTLNGFTRGKMYELEQKKASIKNKFDYFQTVTSSGLGLTINYGTSFPVPTGDDELKRIQINLNIKEWKGEQ